MRLVTSRRISETLLLRHSDVNLEGGGFHDSPHILYQQREEDLHLSGQGKLGEEQIAARLSTDAVEGLKSMKECGLDWQCLPVLEPYKISHPEVFENKPLQKRSFHLKTDDDYMFPAMTKKSGCRPNMARQSINMALDKIRSVMYELTGKSRRWNPEQKCKGQRMAQLAIPVLHYFFSIETNHFQIQASMSYLRYNKEVMRGFCANIIFTQMNQK